MLTKEQAEQIEQTHNVIVDARTGMYTTGDRNDTYGWQPVPAEWIKETE